MIIWMRTRQYGQYASMGELVCVYVWVSENGLTAN